MNKTKYDWLVVSMVIAAMAVLVACVILKPDDAVPVAIGLVTTIVAALRGKMVEKESDAS